MKRPEYMTDEHLEYLDELRESGETNIFGARPYLMREFNLQKDRAGEFFCTGYVHSVT